MSNSYINALSSKCKLNDKQNIKFVSNLPVSNINQSKTMVVTDNMFHDDDDEIIKIKKPSVKQHDRLIMVRRELGITQEELAKRSCVPKKEIIDCEAGKVTILASQWNKIDMAINAIRKEKNKQYIKEK